MEMAWQTGRTRVSGVALVAALLIGGANSSAAVQPVARPVVRGGGFATPALRGRVRSEIPVRVLPSGKGASPARLSVGLRPELSFRLPAAAVPVAMPLAAGPAEAPGPRENLAETERRNQEALEPDSSASQARERAAEGFERAARELLTVPDASVPLPPPTGGGLAAGPRPSVRQDHPPRPGGAGAAARSGRSRGYAWAIATVAGIAAAGLVVPFLGLVDLMALLWIAPVGAALAVAVVVTGVEGFRSEARPAPDAVLLRPAAQAGFLAQRGDSVAMVYPQGEKATDALMEVLAVASARLPAADAAREISRLFAQHQVPAPDRLGERIEGAWTQWGRRRLLKKAFKALADGLSEDPARRDEVLRRVWVELQPAARDLLDSGPAQAARPPPDSPEGAWLSALAAEVSAGLPEAGALDASFFATKALMHGMDRSIPMIFWRDAGSGQARLRVHRSLIRYLLGSAGRKRLSEMGLSPEAMIPILARGLVQSYRSASRPDPGTGRRSTLDDSHQRADADPLSRERLAEVLRSASALGNTYVKFVRWQSYLGLPLLPTTLWFLLRDNLAAEGLKFLWMPPAGPALFPIALGAFALFAWGGSRLYEKAVSRGWIPGSDKNVAYPVLLHMPWAVLLGIIPVMAFIEEAFFRQDLLPLFVSAAATFLAWGPLAALGAAALASSLFFAVAHIPNYLMHRLNAKQFVGSALYFVIAGLVLSVVYWFGGFLLAGVLHALYNSWILWRAKTRWRNLGVTVAAPKQP